MKLNFEYDAEIGKDILNGQALGGPIFSEGYILPGEKNQDTLDGAIASFQIQIGEISQRTKPKDLSLKTTKTTK